MKLKSWNFFSISAVALITSTLSLSAAILTWDPAQTGSGSNGSGTWDSVTTNFATGGSNVASLPAAQTTNTVALASGVNTITVASTTGLAVGQTLSTDRFAAGTTITNITGSNVTLSSNSTNTLGTGSQIFFAQPNEVVFGAGTGAAGTVTVAGTQSADRLTINTAAGGGVYTFTGGSITVASSNGSTGNIVVNGSAIFNSALNWRGISFATTGKSITLAGGSTAGSLVGAFNGNVNGTTDAIAKDSTLAITAGAYSTGGAGNTINIGNAAAATGGLQMSAGTITVGGNFQIGSDGGRNGFANLTGGTINSQGQFTVGRNGATGRVVVDGGTINQTGASTTDTTFTIGRANGAASATLDVVSGAVNVIGNGITNAAGAGGIMVLNADANNIASNGNLNISGGVVTVKELRLNGGNNIAGASTQGSSNVNLTGGSLYIGGIIRDTTATTSRAGGLTNYGTGTSSYAFNVSNGATIGANAAWSSSINMTLGTGGANFKAADLGNLANNITLTGIISGNGPLAKTGLGIVTIGGAAPNTYLGGTTVSEGTLIAATAGSLGTGNITVGSAGLTLQNSSIIADTAILYFGTGSVITLADGVDTLNSIVNSANNQSLTTGTYNAGQLNTIFGGTYFFGNGSLALLPIPEPTSTTLLGLGLVSLTFIRKRRDA